MNSELLLSQYKSAVDASSIFSKTDANGVITYVNDLFCKISGYAKEELIGRSHSILRHPDMPNSLYKSLWETISAGKMWQNVIKNRKKDGSSYYVNSIIYPIKDDDGKILEYISIRQDITEIIQNKKLLDLYSKDPLTNLPNRHKLLEKLKSNTKELMSIVLDIKDISLINELYGENIGDTILAKIALKLKDYITNEGVALYKLHSDQYLILVEDKTLFSKYESLIEFTFLAEDNFIIDDIIVGFNIGVAYGSQELLIKSSLALKEAKKRNCGFYIYDNSINTKNVNQENLNKLNTFRDALINNRVEPFFQPIVDSKSEKIVKYESLARIKDKDGNIIEVSNFLNIARKSSFFENFTRQIIQKSFAVSSSSNQEIAINLTYENINSAQLLKYIENRLKIHNGPKITFEILESEEIANYAVLENFVLMVKKYGSHIAIDDFGSGYSNFAHLLKFKADFIKIDGSIISKLESDENSRMLLSIIISYAAANNIKTVAEYISSVEIANIAKNLGVDLLQGYHYGKAQNAEYYNLT
ncbi:EAL domain-containing protein [bacterium]|nr:EAL domain-containing protein [bacterium]MBU1993791.1 EAL domain-containing protein [bacterium]